MPDPVRVVFLGGLGEIGRNCAGDRGRRQHPAPRLRADVPRRRHARHRPRPARLHLAARERRPDRRLRRHPRARGPRRRRCPTCCASCAFPIYGSALTLGLARNRIEEAGLLGRTELIAVRDGERRDDRAVRRRVHPGHPLGAARLRHRLPHPAGRDPALGRLQARPHAGRRSAHRPRPASARSPPTEGIRLLLSDSTNAEEPGYAPSETSVGAVLRQLFHEHAGRRIITACFASHIHRIQQIADAAIAIGPGRRHARAVDGQERAAGPGARGAAHPRRRRWSTSRTSTSYEPGEVCVISTGSQGEPMSALSLMAARREPLASRSARTTR